MSTTYEPRDQLFLWLLIEPRSPVLIGDLNIVRTSRGVSLRYADTWLARGFALSEDLPLSDQEHLPKEKDTAAGAVDDARPDRWGERVIKFVDKPKRLSLLEYLYFAGDDRFGALGVSTSRTGYLPRETGPLPRISDVDTLHELVRKVLANETIPESQKRLIVPGGTMGGARPKALIEIDGHPWVVKFDAGDPTDTPLVEHASMTLARKAGIEVAETTPLELTVGHAVAVKRFDRRGQRRVHALSSNVALKGAGEELGYPELAQLLRRRGVARDGRNTGQMRELFRRMVFNILIDNTDDHEKNHVLLVDDAAQYELSPAYDVLPSGQALGYQQMRIGEHGADSTLENAMSMCSMFGLRKDSAAAEVRTVIEVVNGWKEHFAACGVRSGDIDAYEEQIDRPFLRDQRYGFS
ncbi:MAG TPA: HipA domain-containing protein [Labilithrix sp.]|jgi:serine/threonine-protein kinase HipA|nr:HipA domain-containing protein [Labilithrix sp.]